MKVIRVKYLTSNAGTAIMYMKLECGYGWVWQVLNVI